MHAKVTEITGGQGVDVAMEASTVPAGMELAVADAAQEPPDDGHRDDAARRRDLRPDGLHRPRRGRPLRRAGPLPRPAGRATAGDGRIARGAFPMDKLITHRFGLDEIGRGTEVAVSRTPGYIKGIVVPS